MTIAELSQLLAERQIASRQLVEQSLAAIKDPNGEGARTFLLVHESEALAAADRVDAQWRSGAKMPALAGIPISIKDLFDEAGVVTLAGSKVSGRHSGGDTRLDSRRPLEKSRRDNRGPHQHDRVRVLGSRHQSALRHA